VCIDFNFGENFITQMDSVGTGRIAAKLFEDSSISENFNLEPGRPQRRTMVPPHCNITGENRL
jgi:hypothetical protein